MGGNSISSELAEYIDYSVDVATVSAFVQQRGKISSSTFPFLFHNFTNSADNLKTYRISRLLAGDGSSINTYEAPDANKNRWQNWQNRVKLKYNNGVNQLYLNVLYDLCNKTYTVF